MSAANRLFELSRTLGRGWFGMWKVRDCYTTLEERTEASPTKCHLMKIIRSHTSIYVHPPLSH